MITFKFWLFIFCCLFEFAYLPRNTELMVPFQVASQDIQGIRSVFHLGTSEGSRSLYFICKHGSQSRVNQTHNYINSKTTPGFIWLALVCTGKLRSFNSHKI